MVQIAQLISRIARTKHESRNAVIDLKRMFKQPKALTPVMMSTLQQSTPKDLVRHDRDVWGDICALQRPDFCAHARRRRERRHSVLVGRRQ